MKLIYLDNGATTFPKPEKVYQAMDYVPDEARMIWLRKLQV